MTFTFNATIPAANHNPSADQPIMLANNVADLGIWNVDHIGFNAANGGTHVQTTFAQFAPSPTVIGGAPGSVLFPAAGVANNTIAQLFFKNSAATYQVSIVKAYVQFNGISGAINSSQSLNVNSVTVNSAGNYTINLATGALATSTFGVFICAESATHSGLSFSYQLVSATSFNAFVFLAGGGITNPNNVSIIVFQV